MNGPEPFIGEIRIFAFDYPPIGWAFCNGQNIPIQQNTVLFSIIGARFGGNGTTFNLPNLQGRTVMGCGTGPGLSPRVLAQVVGTETETLTTAQTPSHSHPVVAVNLPGNTNQPGGNNDNKIPPGYWAQSTQGDVIRPSNINTYAGDPDAENNNMLDGVLTRTGEGGSHQNMQPYLTLNFCICLNGILPPR